MPFVHSLTPEGVIPIAGYVSGGCGVMQSQPTWPQQPQEPLETKDYLSELFCLKEMEYRQPATSTLAGLKFKVWVSASWQVATD